MYLEVDCFEIAEVLCRRGLISRLYNVIVKDALTMRAHYLELFVSLLIAILRYRDVDDAVKEALVLFFWRRLLKRRLHVALEVSRFE